MRVDRCARRASRTILAVLLVAGAAACDSSDAGGTAGDDGFRQLRRGADDAPWQVTAGVEQITVTGAEPGEPLTLYGPRRRRLLTLRADAQGQAHFAYLPPAYAALDSGPDLDYAALDAVHGTTVGPGRYLVVDEEADPRLASDVVRVPGRDDVPDPALYEEQTLTGARLDVLGGLKPGATLEEGFQYLEMRDGVKLSAMVRFPDDALYGEGPWPTVVEYSGYSPSNPVNEEAGVRLARAFGYATVAVNLRGSGCSGGVFDVFNPAQMADGYDVVEIVARQDWVRSNKVGMVGLSYSGITQLFTATTNPPHLAAVTPQSVIADPWLQAWPGGIFNSGFTQQWIKERDEASAPGGTDWVGDRVAAGDSTCAGNLALRSQNPDFENLVHSLPYYGRPAAARDLRELVRDIEAPVFVSGAFQDEQTGPQFTSMLDHFDSTALLRANLWNGRHPDGYAPPNVVRWFEFLELYVADRVPVVPPAIRAALPGVLADQFDVEDVELEPDRWASFGDDVDGARAAYEAEPAVRLVFESGLGRDEVGEPGGTFEMGLDSWPPPEAETTTYYLGADETLAPQRPARAGAGVDAFRFDPDAGGSTLFGGTGDYPLLDRVWATDWTRFDPGEELSYLTPAFTEDTVFAGPGYADLFVASEVEDVHIQVTVSEVRADGTEVLVQNGWLDLTSRREDRHRTEGLEIVHPFTEEAARPLDPGEFVEARIDIPSFAHAFRAGSRLRLSIATPGRNHATWEFENPDYGGAVPTHEVARTRARPSSLVLSSLPGVEVSPPVADPLPCPGLRGQACRPFVATENTPVP
ncbi:MAG TPA: CocE/NonD family hydrolase [Acidimicrobiales bacterium]|nr:CocE/NonD family hydrolase [Acidimicrobiales bacterium]